MASLYPLRWHRINSLADQLGAGDLQLAGQSIRALAPCHGMTDNRALGELLWTASHLF